MDDIDKQNTHTNTIIIGNRYVEQLTPSVASLDPLESDSLVSPFRDQLEVAGHDPY